MTRQNAEGAAVTGENSLYSGGVDSASGGSKGYSASGSVGREGTTHPTPWNLFASPAESNFSGVRYDPALGQAAARMQLPDSCPAGKQSRQWAVLLDAAKACGSRPPDLTANPVDFVVRMSNPSHTVCPILSIPVQFYQQFLTVLKDNAIYGVIQPAHTSSTYMQQINPPPPHPHTTPTLCPPFSFILPH